MANPVSTSLLYPSERVLSALNENTHVSSVILMMFELVINFTSQIVQHWRKLLLLPLDLIGLTNLTSIILSWPLIHCYTKLSVGHYSGEQQYLPVKATGSH